MPKRISLFILVALLALVIGFVTFAPNQAVHVVRLGGYWLVLITFLLFAWHLIKSLRDVDWPRPFFVKCLRPILFILAATAFLHVHERHEFKVVADEVLLSSTAMQMHYHREAGVVLRAYDYAGNFMPFNVFLDKRPLFFSFLLSGVHDLTGYRVSNVFWLNGLVSLALVGLTYILGRRFGGTGAAVGAVLLLCAVPLVAQNVVGGGFELLNLVMLLLTIWLGCRYAEKPDQDRMCAFVLSGVLLAQVRYESALFVLPVGLTILYVWLKNRRIELPWTFIATPLLLTILPLQHSVFKLSEASWQLQDVAGADKPFAFRYFYDNVGHALNFFFKTDGTQPSSWLLATLGILCVGFFLLLLYREHRRIFATDPARAIMAIFIIGLMLHTFLMLCYFWGKWDDPIIRRLSLPAHVLLLLAVLYVWPYLFSATWRWRLLGGLAGAYLIGFTIPASAMHRFTQDNFAARTTNWLGDYLRTQRERRILAIDNNAGLQWFLYRQSSINPARLGEKSEEYVYHFQHRSFTDYLVVQRAGLDRQTGARFVSWEDDLGPGFTLELIEEKAFSPIYLVRLSRVVAIDEEKIKAWSANRKAANKATTKTIVPISSDSDAEQLAEWLKNLP